MHYVCKYVKCFIWKKIWGEEHYYLEFSIRMKLDLIFQISFQELYIHSAWLYVWSLFQLRFSYDAIKGY